MADIIRLIRTRRLIRFNDDVLSYCSAMRGGHVRGLGAASLAARLFTRQGCDLKWEPMTEIAFTALLKAAV